MILRRIEAQAQARARASGLASDSAITARARHLVSLSGGTVNVIEAVDQVRDEAGMPAPASRRSGRADGAADADIVARARRLIAKSGNTLSAAAAVDKAHAELATLASRDDGKRAREAMERRIKNWGRVEKALADTAAALERRLMARELAIGAREAMAAISPLFDRKPDHEPARRILEGASAQAA